MKTTLEMTIQNQSNGIAYVRVYLLKANRDISAYLTSYWKPDNLWNEAMNDHDNGTEYPMTHLGATPYDVTEFGVSWKIIKDRRLVLKPNKQAKIVMHTDEHKAWSLSELMGDLEVSGTPVGAIRNRTYGVMIVAHGQPVSDTTTKTSINDGITRIIGTWVWKCWAGNMIDQQIINYQSSNTVDGRAGGITGMIFQDTDIQETAVVVT